MAAPPPRDPLSYFWSPLCAVGSHDPASGRPNAQICVSVFGASIVPERPRVLVILSQTNLTHDLVRASGTVSVTLLAEPQLPLLEALGLRSGHEHADKLAGLDFTLTAAGDPLFPGGSGWIAGRVVESYALGDATAFLVAVAERARTPSDREPLAWASARALVGEEFLRRWAEQSARAQAAARLAMHWPERALPG